MCFIDASTSTEDLMTYWSSMGAQLEQDVSHWVKAAIDSSLRRLGVVGVMAVEDFMEKMKEVLREVVSSYSPLNSRTSVLDELPVASTSGGPQSLSVSGSVGVQSSIPTLFGEGVIQEGPLDVLSSSGKKPGKNLIRSCDGF